MDPRMEMENFMSAPVSHVEHSDGSGLGAQKITGKSQGQLLFATPFEDPKEHLMNNIPLKKELMFAAQQNAFQFAPWLPEMNTFTPIGINWHSPHPISNNLCSESPEVSKTVNLKEFTSPPKSSVKCYVCDQHVIKSEFALHLFFGSLKCDDCHIKIHDCRSFRSDIFLASNCIHKNISWLENPIEFLKSQQCYTSITDNKKVYRYIKRLRSLEHLLPWIPVFQEYRRLKKLDKKIDTDSKVKCEIADSDTYKCEDKTGNSSNSNCDEVLLLESYDLDQMEDAVQVIGLVDHEVFDAKDNCVGFQSESEINGNKHIKSEKSIKNETDTSHINYQKVEKMTENGVIKPEKIITQIYKSSHTKELFSSVKPDNILKDSSRSQCINSAVENVILKEKMFKKRKPEKGHTVRQNNTLESNSDNNMNTGNLFEPKQPKKKRKLKNKTKSDKNITNKSIKVNNKIDKSIADPGIEYLDLPEDGNYLVTRTPLEECSMCYRKLKVNNSVFNVKLWFYTFWCPCGLKIFYLPKTPSNIEHPVKIIVNS